MDLYDKAISLCKDRCTSAILYSNCSACFLELNRIPAAVMCAEDETFEKGFVRLGAALERDPSRRHEALAAYERAPSFQLHVP